jgi:DNA polymerase III epsilon subunit-like protein
MIEDNVVTEARSWWMQPTKGKLVSKEALEANHMSLELIRLFPEPLKVFIDFKDFLGRHIAKFDKDDKAFFVGYNPGFDLDFIVQWNEDNGDKGSYFFSWVWSSPIINVSDLAANIVRKRGNIRPGLENFKLGTVANRFKVFPEGELHDARADIDLTYKLFCKINKEEPCKVEFECNVDIEDLRLKSLEMVEEPEEEEIPI